MRNAWILASCLAAGCMGRAPSVRGNHVDVASAELVPISPDVKTVADSDQPVFYANDASQVAAYWLYFDGGWYRADALGSRWAAVKHPPVAILQIEQPFAYTHYRRDHVVARTAAREDAAPAPTNTRADWRRMF